MMSKAFEELYSELNSMNIQDIKNALVEAKINFEKCTEPFTAQDIIKQQQETINRQKAEIERLQKENNQFADIGKMYSEIKAEAVKEFAELLKEKAVHIYSWLRAVDVYEIDNLVKEMVGEG